MTLEEAHELRDTVFGPCTVLYECWSIEEILAHFKDKTPAQAAKDMLDVEKADIAESGSPDREHLRALNKRINEAY